MIETLEGFGGLSERRVRFVVEIENWEERVFMNERERERGREVSLPRRRW